MVITFAGVLQQAENSSAALTLNTAIFFITN